MNTVVSFHVLFMKMNCQHHKLGQFYLLKLCNLLDKFKYTLDAEPPNSERNTEAVIAPSTAGRSKGLKWKARKAEGQEAAQGERGEPAFSTGERGEREGTGERKGENRREEKENKKCKGKIYQIKTWRDSK